ncbi:TIMELESS-interacting protein [Acipenser ruthenus]|uniref:TIMELESS-interacting protein n=1 Tax=Acipenser ruthenus TaxID=7906 RepID=A0A444V4Z4_ACIRT|nr:TIMELESS-interacting protein [Acipenser ruthenus]
MQHMEHWAHRLYPKLQFEDFIDKLEVLGNKKEVQPFFSEGQSVPVVQSTPSASSTLTEEQRQRIERNKQLALERRLAKLQQDNSQSRISNGNVAVSQQHYGSSVSAQPPVTQSTPAKPTDSDELNSELELESLDLDTVMVKHTNSTCEQGWELKEGAAPVCADSLKEGDAPVCADSLKEGDAPVCADSLKEGDAPVCADSLKEGDAPVCADSLKESASTEEVSASVPEDQQKVNGIEQDTD